MSRVLAFSLLALAAFDWPAPWLDRLGTAALGLAFLSLAVGASPAAARRALPFGLPSTPVAVSDEAARPASDYVAAMRAWTDAPDEEIIESAASLAQRIAAYEP